MSKTVVALYRELTSAQAAVQDLVDAGYKREALSLVIPDPEEKHAAVVAGGSEDDADDGAAEGAVVGGAIGGLAGLLFGLAAFTVPGLGPLVLAGPVYTAVTGASLGGLGGGLLGALVDAGVPEGDAATYEEGLRRGLSLLAVETPDDEVTQVRTILGRHNPVDVNAVSSRWRKEGWSGPERRPESFEPSIDDESDEHRFETGAMGSDLYGRRANRDDPMDTSEDVDLTG